MPLITPQERVGTVLAGKYRLGRILGDGGMGTVFAAVNQATGRDVAVKLLHPEASRIEDLKRRFLEEARAATAIRHPNVVDVLDLDADESGTPFIVMEILRGETLRARLSRRGSLPTPEAWRILQPAMHAIAAAHSLGIVHRDLKPENIFLHESGDGSTVTKVLDFGIAQVAANRRTATGVQMGTPRYMSPEQARGRDVGPWTDVWAMGVIWFEALTGREPYDHPPDATPAAILAHILTNRPGRLTDALGIDHPALTTIDRALSPRLEDRFVNMGAFETALRDAIGTPASSAAAAGLPATRAQINPRLAATVPLSAGCSSSVAPRSGTAGAGTPRLASGTWVGRSRQRVGRGCVGSWLRELPSGTRRRSRRGTGRPSDVPRDVRRLHL